MKNLASFEYFSKVASKDKHRIFRITFQRIFKYFKGLYFLKESLKDMTICKGLEDNSAKNFESTKKMLRNFCEGPGKGQKCCKGLGGGKKRIFKKNL